MTKETYVCGKRGLFLFLCDKRSVDKGSGGLDVSKGDTATTAKGNLNAFFELEGLAVLALCEVAKVPSLRQHTGGMIWVAPDEESVVTRFLFPFPGGIPECAGDHNSQSASFESEVWRCLAGLGKPQDEYPL